MSSMRRSRYSQRPRITSAAYAPASSTQILSPLQQLTSTLNEAKLREGFDALANNDPEEFMKVAQEMISEGSPDSSRLKDLMGVAKQSLDEQQWQTDVQSGAKTLEQFQSYLQSRLDSAQPGSNDASKLVLSISQVSDAIKARDEAAKDQKALLSYVNTQDNVAYASYLKDKLIRTTDPAMQATIANQINTLSQRQDKKEQVQRAVTREQTVQAFQQGKMNVEDAVNKIAALRDQATDPSEAQSYQTDINSIFQLDIAHKRNDILSQWSSGQMSGADAIARLQTLANGPADESTINSLTSAIDHVRSTVSSAASSAAAAGTSQGAASANEEYVAAVADVNKTITAGGAPTEPQLRRVEEAGKQLAVAENAVGDMYNARGNATSAETWYKRAAGRDAEVSKLFDNVDNAAFKKAGVTSQDAAAFKAGLSNLSPDAKIQAILGEMGRLSQVTGLTYNSSQKAKDVYQTVLAAGKDAVNGLTAPNEEDKATLDKAYADYQNRMGGSGGVNANVFDAYLKDLAAGRINMDQFNEALGLGAKPMTGVHNPFGPSTKPASGAYGYTNHDQNGAAIDSNRQLDPVLSDAIAALGNGLSRSYQANQKLISQTFKTNPDLLNQSERDQYIESFRENQRGTRPPGQPTIPPVSMGGAPNDIYGMSNTSMAMPPDAGSAGNFLSASGQGGDMWAKAYDMLDNSQTTFDLPAFNIPDLPPPTPIQFTNDNNAFKDTPDISLTSGTVAPPDNVATPSGDATGGPTLSA